MKKLCVLVLMLSLSAPAQAQVVIGGDAAPRQPSIDLSEVNDLLKDMAEGEDLGANVDGHSEARKMLAKSMHNRVDVMSVLGDYRAAVNNTINTARTYFPNVQVETWGKGQIGFVPPSATSPAKLMVPKWAVK